MTDPKETTNDTAVQQHNAGRPNEDERDPDSGSDVGGPAGGVETTLENDLEDNSVSGEDETDKQAQNPL